MNCPRIQCDHGLVIPNDKNHPVCAFMDDYFINGMRKGMANAPNLRDTFEKHTLVWNNYRHRKMAASILIRMSTNLLLSNDVDIVLGCLMHLPFWYSSTMTLRVKSMQQSTVVM